MTLAPGTRLGPYEVTAQIGEGGMGEVYRATDTHLKRAVAIKVLPASVAGDSDRLARFQREAEVLAALNHPNIAGIYGLEQGPAEAEHHIRALVMELVEGDDLSQRIGRGAIPIEEALPIAKQIAEALEAAHEAGIIHRDLKPANIKVRADGTVKVLDFGLAKAMDPSPGLKPQDPGLQDSPTITSPAMTQMGMILGTAAYMSPEQAKGRPVDRRTDIFAFGCVLYEMLTGRRAFEGDDVTEVLGAVVRLEPDWTRLPAACPPSIHRLLRLCLEKNVRNRRSSATDVRLDLEEAARGPQSVTPASTAPPRRARLPWVAAAVLLLSTVTLSLLYFRPAPALEVMRFEITPPAGRTVAPAQFAVSPDGKHIVFVAVPNGILFVRSIETGEARPLAGTNDPQSPFWSPDSRSVGFFAQGTLKKVEISSGLVQTISPATGTPTGAWSRDGVIVFGPVASGVLHRVAADGGTPSPLTPLKDGEIAHHRPNFLPDGTHFLYNVRSTLPNVRGAYIGSLDGGPATRILETDQKVEFAPPDQLIFAREGQLFAQSFALDTLRIRGAPTRLAERVSVVFNYAVGSGGAEFSVGNTGALVVVHGGGGSGELELRVLDRTGRPAARFDPDFYIGLELSPDGNRLAAHRHKIEGGDLWITDLQTKADRRFTFEPSEDASSPVWSPDGTMIAFAALRGGRWGVYRKPASGGGNAELLHESATAALPMAWAPDGQTLILVDYATGTQDLWLLPLSGNRRPTAYLETPVAEAHPQISPDGRWISYTSYPATAIGTREVWVQSYPVPGIKYQVPLAYARQARWRADGKELIVSTLDAIVAVPIESKGSALAFGPPAELFKATLAGWAHRTEGLNYFSYDVSADGQTFVLPRELVSGSTLDVRPPMTVILNWRGLLGKN